jgi:alpha-beta hydrolase superfamily lysophospholipase
MSEGKDLDNQEISWDVDGIAVNATLTLEAANGRRVAVALVAGSGPTDRDWDSPLLPGTNGSGKLLAEALARAGFVTLRYDKRGSGPRARENAARLAGRVGLQSHVDELAGAVAALAARPEVDAGRIFALTNSEGAIHALNYQRQATKHRFAGLVLTGVPGRSMADTMRSQVVPQLQALPNGADLVRQYDATIAAISAGRPFEIDPSLPEGLRTLFASLTHPANNPFAGEFLAVDPAELLREVTEPVLIVIGKKDIQANWQADGQALEAALAGRDNVTFVYPENANHVLKYEPQPREQLAPAEVAAGYNAADRHLDPGALKAIQTWLGRQAAVDPVGHRWEEVNSGRQI